MLAAGGAVDPTLSTGDKVEHRERVEIEEELETVDIDDDNTPDSDEDDGSISGSYYDEEEGDENQSPITPPEDGDLFLVHNPYCNRQVETVGLVEKEVYMQKKACVMFATLLLIMFILFFVLVHYYSEIKDIPPINCLDSLVELCQFSMVVLGAMIIMYSKILYTKIRVLYTCVRTVIKDKEEWNLKYRKRFGKGSYHKNLIHSVKDRVYEIRYGEQLSANSLPTADESSKNQKSSKAYDDFSDEESHNLSASEDSDNAGEDDRQALLSYQRGPEKAKNLLHRMLISSDDEDGEESNQKLSIRPPGSVEPPTSKIAKVDKIIGDSVLYEPLHVAATNVGNRVRKYENYTKTILRQRKNESGSPVSPSTTDLPQQSHAKSVVEDLHMQDSMKTVSNNNNNHRKMFGLDDISLVTPSSTLPESVKFKNRNRSIKYRVQKRLTTYKKWAMALPVMHIITCFIWIVMTTNVGNMSDNENQIVIVDSTCTSAYIYNCCCVGLVLFFNFLVGVGISLANEINNQQQTFSTVSETGNCAASGL